jgi:cytosolic phospholipase A2
MFIVKYHLYAFALITSITYSDTLTVYNHTPRDVYIAVYYQAAQYTFSDSNAQRVTPIYCLESGKVVVMERPAWSIWYNRELIFNENQSLLANTISGADVVAYHAKNVDGYQNMVCHLADDEGEIYGYNAIDWNLVQVPFAYAQQQFLNMLPAINNNPYKNTVAHIRMSNDLCDQEYAYCMQRAPIIQACLNNYCHNKRGSHIPTIALVCSGGGYRAMLYTIGALEGITDLQLLDGLMYVVGLSGSTWAIGTWISSGKSIHAFHNWIVDNIGFDMKECDSDDITLMGNTLLTKYFSGQPLGFVDIYGSCIANDIFDFFSDDKIQVHLSDQSKYIASGVLPLPLYTAISGQTSNLENLWYEFSPYEVGASWLNAYVPTWAFGRKFKNGISVSNAPEQPMGTLLGTFGLALGITLKRMLQESNIADDMKFTLTKKLLGHIIAHFGDDRPISAEYFNCTFGVPQTPFNDVKISYLVDAGINCNLPYPPISGQRAARKADIIIFVDASGDTVGNELRNVEAYARTNNLPFPAIDYTHLADHAVSVFQNVDDTAVPVVIYIPRVVDKKLLEDHKNDMSDLYAKLINFDVESCIDKGACNTFNFSYTHDQAEQLIALGQFNTIMAADVIRDAVILKS